MPTEIMPGGVSIMKLTVGEMFKSVLFGLVGGVIATLILFTIGDKTDEVIYGASVNMTRFFVTVVCSIACLTAEMSANTSAREVGVDIVISFVVASLAVKDSNFLNHADKMETFKEIMWPIAISVVLAAVFSDPIQQKASKFFEKKPFEKKE